LTILNKIQQ